MLADPAYDGLDELHATLADLKAKRDALPAQTRLAIEAGRTGGLQEGTAPMDQRAAG